MNKCDFCWLATVRSCPNLLFHLFFPDSTLTSQALISSFGSLNSWLLGRKQWVGRMWIVGTAVSTRMLPWFGSWTLWFLSCCWASHMSILNSCFPVVKWGNKYPMKRWWPKCLGRFPAEVYMTLFRNCYSPFFQKFSSYFGCLWEVDFTDFCLTYSWH